MTGRQCVYELKEDVFDAGRVTGKDATVVQEVMEIATGAVIHDEEDKERFLDDAVQGDHIRVPRHGLVVGELASLAKLLRGSGWCSDEALHGVLARRWDPIFCCQVYYTAGSAAEELHELESTVIYRASKKCSSIEGIDIVVDHGW